MCVAGKMPTGKDGPWSPTWMEMERSGSVILQETVINTEFLGNQVKENSLCGSV